MVQKTRTIEITESYKSCDFCDKPAHHEKCFICEKDICVDHRTQFDIIDYDLVCICPDCEGKDYTELKKLNNKYMQLCKVAERVSNLIKTEKGRLKG